MRKQSSESITGLDASLVNTALKAEVANSGQPIKTMMHNLRRVQNVSPSSGWSRRLVTTSGDEPSLRMRRAAEANGFLDGLSFCLLGVNKAMKRRIQITVSDLDKNHNEFYKDLNAEYEGGQATIWTPPIERHCDTGYFRLPLDHQAQLDIWAEAADMRAEPALYFKRGYGLCLDIAQRMINPSAGEAFARFMTAAGMEDLRDDDYR